MRKLNNPARAVVSAGYFKTGKGEYGEGDVFLGITVPLQRQLAKKYMDLSLPEIEQLLANPIHEFRFTALLILVEQYEKGSNKEQKTMAEFYLAHLKNVNNWDLVDTSASYILGDFLLNRDKKILYKLAVSPNIWERRVAIISTQYFIKYNHFEDTLKLAEMLLNDKHDLIHKAVGWMLREVGNKNKSAEIAFLDLHYQRMPRTMLRYAIEKFDDKTRQRYLAK